MSFCSASDVYAFTSNLLNGASAFSASTTPSSTAVTAWLSSGCSIIESHLSAWGYSVPPGSSDRIWSTLSDLNAFFAVARAELSRAMPTIGPGDRTRGQVFNDMFWKGLTQLKGMDLTEVGLSRRSADKIYVGGTTISGKDTQESDSDRVSPRFSRGQFQYPGSVYPDNSSTTAS